MNMKFYETENINNSSGSFVSVSEMCYNGTSNCGIKLYARLYFVQLE